MLISSSTLSAFLLGIVLYAMPNSSQAVDRAPSNLANSVRDDSNTLILAKNHREKRKMGGKKKMGKRAAKAPYEYFEAKGLFATGLVPVFPEGLDCPPISSPYGSQTRYDGSQRNNSHHDYHNGMDISLEPGTPLLAVADGTVVHKGTAGQLVGNYVWLHLAPQSTQLSIHIFARYQHLDEPSPLNVGDLVKAGDIVGSGGATGTTGGHFGSSGYSHLHLIFSTGPSADHQVSPDKPLIKHATQNYLDPLGLYLDKSMGAVTNHALRDLSSDQKKVSVPVRTTDGRTVPKGANLVWPLACQ
ncbi:MAG: M23 family metallopeptidase [Rhodospirillales bacterium]|jgi:murein DD-endopeptidase MepM/ murein hydrolase activator NlpD|nr:M23 family metallopeptidase [Rhodospirillales bacterium]